MAKTIIAVKWETGCATGDGTIPLQYFPPEKVEVDGQSYELFHPKEGDVLLRVAGYMRQAGGSVFVWRVSPNEELPPQDYLYVGRKE